MYFYDVFKYLIRYFKILKPNKYTSIPSLLSDFILMKRYKNRIICHRDAVYVLVCVQRKDKKCLHQ